MNYIALLRAVNVSGKNRVPMRELKAAMESHGFTDVQTYINSGNVLFANENSDLLALQGEIAAIIKEQFDLVIDVCVLRAKAMADVIAAAPEWWGESEGVVHNAIFVIPPVTAESVAAQVGPIKEAFEQCVVHSDVIYWSAPRATHAKTRWAKVHSMPVNSQVTIRNANTVRKLAAMADNK